MEKMSTRPQAVLSRRLAVAGFFELIEKKKYDEITIRDICEQGGISRQTFYRNFSCKEDVIRYYIDHIVRVHMEKIEGTMEKDVEMFFAHLPFSEKFLAFLSDNHLTHLLSEAVLPLIESSMQQPGKWSYILLNDHKYDSYYARYLAGTMVSILESWRLSGFKESKNELNLIMQEFMKGMSPVADYLRPTSRLEPVSIITAASPRDINFP